MGQVVAGAGGMFFPLLTVMFCAELFMMPMPKMLERKRIVKSPPAVPNGANVMPCLKLHLNVSGRQREMAAVV